MSSLSPVGLQPIADPENPPRQEVRPEDSRIAPIAKREIVFCHLTPAQKKSYIYALGCRTANRTVATIKDLARTTLSMLTGLQFSGLLNNSYNTRVSTTSDFTATYLNTTDSLTTPNSIDTPSNTLGELLDQTLVLRTTTLLYISGGGWVVAHTFSPGIQRFLQSEEDRFLQQIFLAQENGARELSRSPALRRSTLADKISFLIDYFLPVLFDGMRTALFLRAIKQIPAVIRFPGSAAQYWTASRGDLLLTVTTRISEIVISMSSGEDPVSDNILILLLVSGTCLYTIQAWANFYHDLGEAGSVPRLPPPENQENQE